MTNPNLETHLPVARGLARLKARTVIGRCGLTANDREDIEAQLLLAFCVRFRKFDGRRSSIKTFSCRVMDTEIASVLRYRMARRRQQSTPPERIDDSAADHACDVSPSTAQCQEFWLDVAKIMKRLPAPLRETVLALRCGSPAEASQTLGTARSVVYDHIAQIRHVFRAAGIGPAYFTPGGAR